jgi:hypothetical protein
MGDGMEFNTRAPRSFASATASQAVCPGQYGAVFTHLVCCA